MKTETIYLVQEEDGFVQGAFESYNDAEIYAKIRNNEFGDGEPFEVVEIKLTLKTK